jgi:hypothetical protein
MTTATATTLGEMTAEQLIDSARNELKGLEEQLRKNHPDVFTPVSDRVGSSWIDLYLTSIHCRLIVAANKNRDEGGSDGT